MENSENTQFEKVGRNEPCPCGNGKKYKRCHGLIEPVVAKVEQSESSSVGAGGAKPQLPGGLDPSQFDPAMMAQMSQMLGRMPKGQLQKMQALMAKAMAGKDISREAGDFEKTLPVELQQLLMQMPQAAGDVNLGADAEAAATVKKESRFSKMWGSLTGKK